MIYHLFRHLYFEKEVAGIYVCILKIESFLYTLLVLSFQK